MMKQVFVLGDGQLGRMLRQAGEPLGIAVQLFGDNVTSASPTLAEQALPLAGIQPEVITAEIERWAVTPLTEQLAQHSAFINREVFPLIADRLRQKQLLSELNLPTADWQLLSIAPVSPASCAISASVSETADDWSALFSRLGARLMVKSRTGGYDGRGQWQITAANADSLPPHCHGNCIVEQMVDFSAEVSLIGARSHDGECLFYPLTGNLHQHGILRASVALPDYYHKPHKQNAQHQHPQQNLQHLQQNLQQQAQTMLSAIMQRLNYVGVMAMECFVTDQGLLINELAPRVHNSGHWTQNGASISQFALHLCQILRLPVAPPQVDQPSVMVNLLGCELNYQWLSVPHLHLHWYDKVVREGRKVGHLNLTAANPKELMQSLSRLQPLLPEQYASALQWARARLMDWQQTSS